MADALPNDKLRQYLRELTPEARSLLAAELERALLRGEAPPGASAILEELRKTARRERPQAAPCRQSAAAVLCAVEPFLVDDTPERKHRGRIARACLDPIWKWICRDLMPREARSYSDQVQLLLAANEKNGAEQVARAFQDLAEQRMRECLASIKNDEKALQRVAGQIGTPHAIEDVREIAAILRVRDALGVIASRLPATISNLADEQLDNVRALLDLADRAPSRRVSLCAPDRDEPARLAVAADPPRHSRGGKRRRRRASPRRRSRSRSTSCSPTSSG